MKKLLILIMSLFVFSLIYSQSDQNIPIDNNNNYTTSNPEQIFPPGWNTPEWWIGSFSAMAVYTNWGEITIRDIERGTKYPLKIGDWVGVFCVDLDGTLKCAGANQWVFEDQNLGINMVADDWTTPDHKEGFYENEEIIIKVYRWDIYDEILVDNNNISYGFCGNYNYDCDGHFNNGMLYVVDTLTADITLLEHDLTLDDNWSFISSYIKPIEIDGWYIADMNFDLNNIYRENGKQGFLLSVPGLRVDDGTEEGVEIGSIEIRLEGKSLFEKVREKIFGENN